VLGAGGAIEDQYPKTPRDALRRVDVRIEVTVRGKNVPCRAWQVDRYLSSTLYLLEPERDEDRWITQRLYGGGVEDRLAQEILLGVGGVRLLHALGLPIDVYHFNEGHAVFAGHELVREQIGRGRSFDDAVAHVRRQLVFTTHTPVPAGNESHELALLEKMGATLGLRRADLERLGG
jgi:starch phosphorylase